MDLDINRVGFWSGIAAFSANMFFVIAQTLQLLGILGYPYDEILIYGFSLCIVVPFLLEMLALHYVIDTNKRFWSHGALLFTIIYAVFVTSNYVVQLATVIPATLNGRTDKIAVLVQYPHSMFWDFDAIGYISMGITSVMLLPLFRWRGFEKWVKAAFLANALVTPLIGFVYFYPEFSEELLLLAIPWAITAPAMMLLLAIWFKKQNENRAWKGSIVTRKKV